MVTRLYDVHHHELPRARRWRANGRVYACRCGQLLVCRWHGAGDSGVWVWDELQPVDEATSKAIAAGHPCVS